MEKKSFLKPRTISSIKDFVCVVPALLFLAVFTYYPIGKLIQISFTGLESAERDVEFMWAWKTGNGCLTVPAPGIC